MTTVKIWIVCISKRASKYTSKLLSLSCQSVLVAEGNGEHKIFYMSDNIEARFKFLWKLWMEAPKCYALNCIIYTLLISLCTPL